MRPAAGRCSPVRKDAPARPGPAASATFPAGGVVLPGRRQQTMFALSDSQMEAVMTAGADMVEKRSVFLDRVAAQLQRRGRRFTAADLEKAVRMALTGHSVA